MCRPFDVLTAVITITTTIESQYNIMYMYCCMSDDDLMLARWLNDGLSTRTLIFDVVLRTDPRTSAHEAVLDVSACGR